MTMPIRAKLIMVPQLRMSLTDFSSANMLPACTQTKLYGNRPTSAVGMKMVIGMPSRGDVMLINQFGETGTSLIEIIKYGNLSLFSSI